MQKSSSVKNIVRSFIEKSKRKTFFKYQIALWIEIEARCQNIFGEDQVVTQ